MIPLASPDITQQEIEAVVRVLSSGMLVQGAEVAALETELCGYLGAGNAMMASNGTATLQLALAALGVGQGDEVIVPSLSYIATANAVELAGARPVFVDIEERTFNINAALIEAAITPRTKVIMPVHEFGLACDIVAIHEIATKHGLAVIEDAACGLGAKDHGRFAGTVGHFGSFSFHPRKAITSGEGGALVTNDKSLADKVRILRNHGVEMKNGQMDFVAAGYNFRLTDFQAAMIRPQLHRLTTTLEKRQQLAEVYLNEIRNPSLRLPIVPPNKRHAWQTFHLLLDPEMDQQKTLTKLREAGVGCNYGAQCMPAQTYFQKKYGHDSMREFPHGFNAWSKGVAVPLYEKLTQAEVSHISQILNTL